tara:strand:- start:4047 stop:4349 length:303 start_codon:yes stop_codon:yes gene_type:complete
MTPFFAAFNFVRQSKAAQIILTVGIILLIWFANNAYQRSVGASRQKIKAREKEIEVIQEINDNEPAIIKRAQAARAAAIAAKYPDADSVPDKLGAVLFDD